MSMILRPERMSSTEVRDLKTYSSQLLKQIDSKDAKIDSLISELQHSRSNILSLQVIKLILFSQCCISG